MLVTAAHAASRVSLYVRPRIGSRCRSSGTPESRVRGKRDNNCDYCYRLAEANSRIAATLSSMIRSFAPDKCVEWLEGRLPRPIDDLEQWKGDDE